MVVLCELTMSVQSLNGEDVAARERDEEFVERAECRVNFMQRALQDVVYDIGLLRTGASRTNL